MSLYPLGPKSATTALKFDLWMAYNGPASGGVDRLNFATFGLNHAANEGRSDRTADSDMASGSRSGWSSAGAARDYRAYVGDPGLTPVELQGVDGGFLIAMAMALARSSPNPAVPRQLDCHLFPARL